MTGSGVVPPARGVGEFAVVDALPDVVVVAFAAVTHLADPWFLFVLLAGGYWFADERVAPRPRRAGATAVALVACGYAAVALGKALSAVPRPPAASGPVDVPAWLPGVLAGWYEGQLVSDGFGFPSGHAMGAAVAYGALAVLATGTWTRRRRYAAAAAVAVAVALSRVVIEVHYLVDVVAGVAVGVVALAGGLWLAGDPRLRRGMDGNRTEPLHPIPVFALAAGVSVVAAGVAVAGGHTDEVVEAGIGVGTGVGGAVGWRLVEGDEPPVPVRIALPGLAATGGLWIGAYALSGGAVGAIAATGLAVVGVIAMPAVPRVVGRADVSGN